MNSLSLHDMRKEYAQRTLDEASVSPDPIKQFTGWWDEATQSGIE